MATSQNIDVITNIDEKIQKTSILGFGIWFKWLPLAFQNSKIDPECLEQFIFSLQNQENKQFIQILFFKYKEQEYKLNLFGDYFAQEEILLENYFDGVWVFFNSFFDFAKKSSMFYLYQSFTKELIQLKINEIPIFEAQIQYLIGGICDQCALKNFINCFSQFQGKLSTLFEQDNFDEPSYLIYIQLTFENFINDCVEYQNKFDDYDYEGDQYQIWSLGILQKLYFQLNGWVKINYDNSQNIRNIVFQIAYTINDNFEDLNIILKFLYYLSQDGENLDDNGIALFTNNEAKLIHFIHLEQSVLKQWHFIQFDFGYPDQPGTLKFYSFQLNQVIELQFDLGQYTGIQYWLYFGGDPNTNIYFKGTMVNIQFRSFCQPSELEFVVKCHQTCLTCFGPFSDNCLSCKSSSKRFLKNNQCFCESGSFLFQEYEVCQTIDDIFPNLNIIEEELPCKLEGYDRCDDIVICSFGYFKYSEKYCIKCPYYNDMNSDPNVLCYDCFIAPNRFEASLTCTIDVFQLNQGGKSTYNKVERNQENFECFEILQSNNQFQLLLKQNLIRQNPPICRKGFYYKNEKCHQCIFGCQKCKDSIICSKCQDGYYLDNNRVCTKCQNCLKCELYRDEYYCLQCPEKSYMKDQQCFQCGQFCANCRSNGYCNYCIDSQKYFISIDGINCLTCNIPNCKYCYQVYNIDNQILYPSFVLYLENYPHDQLTSDSQIYCAKCQEGYILDLNTNACVKYFYNTVCLFGYFTQDKLNLQCESLIQTTDGNSCNYIRNCKFCINSECIECYPGFYVDLFYKDCQECLRCKDCIQQNQKLMDGWKIEIKPWYNYMKLKLETEIQENYSDYDGIECISCPQNYILYNSICIEGCNSECLKCEIIKEEAKCVECKPFDDKIIQSLDNNGQCLRCKQNCELCYENSEEYLKQINQLFIDNQKYSIYTRSCYKPMQPKNGRQNFFNQFTVIDCEKFNKCKRKGAFTWNLYCDWEQFQHVKDKSGYFQQGNYFLNIFFSHFILNQVEFDYLLFFLNEQVIEEIDIILNIFQGQVDYCYRFSEYTYIFNKFQNFVFFFKGVNLKIIGQKQNVLLKEFNFIVEGFSTIQFENINFDSNRIIFTDSLISSVSLINCTLGNYSKIEIKNSYNLNLINVTMEVKNISENPFFQFKFEFEDLGRPDIFINIDGLKIINLNLNNNKLIYIYTDVGPKVNIQINNLEIFDSVFYYSSLLYTSASDGVNDLQFGTLVMSNLKVNNTILETSNLFYLPNVVKLSINILIIDKINLQYNSYLLLSNQLNCANFYLNEVRIDQSYLFSNKVPLLYQKNYYNQNKIYFNEITIQKVLYSQEQSLLQIIKYNNNELIVNLNYFRITQASPMHNELYFLQQEKSLIHIYCSQCYLNQIEINRQNGYPEFSILDSQQITISNSYFTQNSEQLQNLFSDCSKKITNQSQYFFFIGQYQKVKFYNLTILDAISLNYPFIILQGINAMSKYVLESIEIINSTFENNKLITQLSNSPTSIIQIETKQKSYIDIKNVQFRNNHLNMEIQDLMIHSSSTLIIDTQVGRIFMNNCLFEQNIVTNSPDSITYIKAQVVEIINSRFIKNNILKFHNLFNRIQLDTFGSTINAQDIYQVVQVLSNGGSGYFLTKYFSLKNCSVEESYSLNGGAFYINTFGDASILIENSTFVNTSSSLKSSASSAGGCFYIDAQVSKLTLFVINTIFNQSFSRSKGGCFFILPSDTYNLVYFEQIKIINSFSTTSQFFDFSLQNLQNIISNVTFYDVQIIYDEKAFYYFLGQLDNLSTDEATTLLNNDPLIKVKYGNVTFHTVDCKSESKIFLIAIDQGQFINLFQISIENGFIRNSPFLSFNFKFGVQGLLQIQNLKIDNLQEFLEINEQQKCKEILIKNTYQQFCISPLYVSNHNVQENDVEVEQQIKLCQNQNLINKSEKYKFSLIMISNIITNHKIIIKEIFFNEIHCRNCENGLLSLTNIVHEKENNIILQGIIIQNSQCGITGCLTIINKNSNNYLKTNYLKKESRNLQQQNWEQLKSSFNYQVSLYNSKFLSNMADYGGAICVIDIDILINQCLLFNNTAKIGGAIYSFTSQQQNYRTIMFASFLIDNQAELAANIYLENQMLQQTKKLNIIMENNSSTQEGVVFERPRSLAISTNQGSLILQKKVVSFTSTKVVEKTIIKTYTIIGLKEKVETLMFPSGQKIRDYYYFDVSNLNKSYSVKHAKLEGRLTEWIICTLRHKVVNITDLVEIDDPYVTLSIYSFTFNSNSLDFNLNNLIVYFNPYYDEEIVLRLFIQCDMIQIPIYDENPPFLIENYITDYELFVDIKTFPCQLGEYFNSTSKICIKCNSDQSQYQVEQNAPICSIKDETKMNSVESEKIELKPKFWRVYFYSTKIEECYHLPENCLGGWQPGDKSCTLGHIGALCEQCDLYNIRGDGQFSISSQYKCGNCDQIEGNIITISLISLWTLISVLMSVNSTIDTINQFVARKKLVLFGVSSTLFKQSSTAVLIKVFTNYLQIIQTITTFQLKVPSGLSQILTSVGNPIEQVAYSLDCFLISITNISIIYFRIIWSFLMAISYMSTFFLFLALGILLKKIKFNISMITTALIYIFIFLQPNIISSLISLVSFRTLSNVTWIQGNVAYLYDTKSHKNWLISFCLPILIIFSLLIPFYMFNGIRSNRHHLEQNKTRETWGYLYNEYKLKAYYWEFIKIFQKELIIIFLAFYEDYIAIKAALVFLVIFAYSFISTKVSPYMTGELNRFDTQSTTVCAVSIILGSSIYTAQNQNFIEIVYPFYIIIALINSWFLIKMIINILLAYFDKLHEQIDKVKKIISQKFPDYLIKYPQAEKLLESKKKKLQRIQSRFAKIKQYLIPRAKKILKLKKEIQLDKLDFPIFLKFDQTIQTNYTAYNKNQNHQNYQIKLIIQDSKEQD